MLYENITKCYYTLFFVNNFYHQACSEYNQASNEFNINADLSNITVCGLVALLGILDMVTPITLSWHEDQQQLPNFAQKIYRYQINIPYIFISLNYICPKWHFNKEYESH